MFPGIYSGRGVERGARQLEMQCDFFFLQGREVCWEKLLFGGNFWKWLCENLLEGTFLGEGSSVCGWLHWKKRVQCLCS